MNQSTASDLSATEAATRLGVSLPTLYAYVSRGLIRSRPSDSRTRHRLYLSEDVERLLARKATRSDPAAVAQRALHWGAPVLDSSITLIQGGRLHYRGVDAVTLSREATVEQVAAFLWTGHRDTSLFMPLSPATAGELRQIRKSIGELPPISLFESALPILARRDARAYDLSRESTLERGAQLVNILTSLAAGCRSVPSAAETLRRAWLPRGKSEGDILRAALVLCADHELNISSFTARCIASAGSTLYAVLAGALAAVEGVRHGGASARVEALLREIERDGSARRVVRDRLQRGEEIPGFGHPLYRDGDPRAEELLRLLREQSARSPELRRLDSVARQIQEIVGGPPTVDFALVAIRRVLVLPASAPLTIFALGRSIGWIGHALEQYADPESIRPRARYVGPRP